MNDHIHLNNPLRQKTKASLSSKELHILQAVAEHAYVNTKGRADPSQIPVLHETELAEKTGIALDELMTVHYDQEDRVRRSGLIQSLSAKLMVALTDGDPKDRFGYIWLTPAGMQASHSKGPFHNGGTTETRDA